MPGAKRTVPKVAVITRTKNRLLFLERALKSVDNQTYDDYVHVVFNDGGEKEPVDRLLKKHKNDKRIVVHNKKNLDVTKALNQGIRSVDSEYVAILDDDDSWEPELLEKTVGYLERTKSKAVVVKMDLVVEDVREGRIVEISRKLHPESGEGEINLFKQCYQNYISNGNVTYRREVYEELGGYDESLEVAEDWDFGIRLLMKYDVGFLGADKPLVRYHQRPGLKGDEGNSVHAKVEQQEKTINIIRNKYMRKDLQSGKLGIGYIMNKHADEISKIIRLEGHINYSNQQLEERLNDRFRNLINRFFFPGRAKSALGKFRNKNK